MLALGAIISGITGLTRDWIQGKRDKHDAETKVKLAELENKARLLLDKENNNQAWEMAQLTDKDKWLRRASFVMFASPFLIAMFSPAHVSEYFHVAISSVPEWWQKTFMAITGGIWGLGSLKNALPAVIDSFKKK